MTAQVSGAQSPAGNRPGGAGSATPRADTESWCRLANSHCRKVIVWALIRPEPRHGQ